MKRYIHSISLFLTILLIGITTLLQVTPVFAQQPNSNSASFLRSLHKVPAFHRLQPLKGFQPSRPSQGLHARATSGPGAGRYEGGKYDDNHMPTVMRFAGGGSPMINLQTPLSLRAAYGLEPLIRQGYTGKGQTVVVIDSFGSPTLQHDLDTFSAAYDLPNANLRIITPLPLPPFDKNNGDMMGWAGETTLDVETIHAIAPDANIVLLPSPVSETEGTVGFPEYLQLEQYAIANHLGKIFSQSYGASELTLADPAGQALVKQYSNFYQWATLQNHVTVLTASGDHGATDALDDKETLAHVRTTSFPDDVPWVTAVGGASVYEDRPPTAWQGSGGGASSFFALPEYQKVLPSSMQNTLKGKRGVPDVAANADPSTAMPIFFDDSWQLVGGTSASTPQWAAIIAIANQMAGRPLGFINPALYRLGASARARNFFTNITTGNNDNPQAGVTGYPAGPGWSPVTGWGLPNAVNLLPALIAATPA